MFKVSSVTKFFNQVKLEVSKVTWPSRSELINSTIMIIVVVFVISLICLGVDFAISSLIKKLLDIGRL